MLLWSQMTPKFQKLFVSRTTFKCCIFFCGMCWSFSTRNTCVRAFASTRDPKISWRRIKGCYLRLQKLRLRKYNADDIHLKKSFWVDTLLAFSKSVAVERPWSHRVRGPSSRQSSLWASLRCISSPQQRHRGPCSYIKVSEDLAHFEGAPRVVKEYCLLVIKYLRRYLALQVLNKGLNNSKNI